MEDSQELYEETNTMTTVALKKADMFTEDDGQRAKRERTGFWEAETSFVASNIRQQPQKHGPKWRHQ